MDGGPEGSLKEGGLNTVHPAFKFHGCMYGYPADTVETAYKVYVCPRRKKSTLYADLLNNQLKVTLNGYIGALIYLLYK